jgi:manganese/zinc/iron transport system ATP- binding protein
MQLIEVTDLTVSYDKKPVLWDVKFSVPKGALVAVIGPNGAGKSTLIQSIMGFVSPNSGKIRFFGKPIKEFYKKIAYVGQRASIDWDFPITVIEVLEMGIYGKLGWFKRPSKLDKKRVEEVLEQIGLKELASRQISELSGGQQQRLFIGRALLQDADIYFLDEPFQGIDVRAEMLIVEILKDLSKKGKTLFVVHHDLNTVESYFDYAILLNMRLIAAGPLKEVFKKENLLKAFGQKEGLLEEAFLKQRVRQEGIL